MPNTIDWKPEDRKTVLLRAAFELLCQARSAHYVQSAMDIPVFYDNAKCDGRCLLDDIALELESIGCSETQDSVRDAELVILRREVMKLTELLAGREGSFRDDLK